MKKTIVLCAVLILVAGPAGAQQVTGELGSPSATTTISEKQLPPPDVTGERGVTTCSSRVGSQSGASSSLVRTAILVSRRRTLPLSWNCWANPLTAAQTTPTKAARSSKSD
jgi:hypothetical protein